MAGTVLKSPLRYCPDPWQFASGPYADDPQRSPAKRLRYGTALLSDVGSISEQATAMTRPLQASVVNRPDTKQEAEDLARTPIAAALRSIKKKAEKVMEKYLLYESVLQVYDAVCSGKVPVGVHFADTVTKRRSYQMVFDVLHRTYYTVNYYYCCFVCCYTQ